MALTEAASEDKPRIVIVDDDGTDREALVRALSRQEGEYDAYELLTATDGASAQQVLSENGVDVVISDVNMPDMTGLELMRWAKENCPGPTWIFVTGEGTLEDAGQAVRLGAFDFLVKGTGVTGCLPIAVQNALRQRRLEANERHLHEKLTEKVERLRERVFQLDKACRLVWDQVERQKPRRFEKS